MSVKIAIKKSIKIYLGKILGFITVSVTSLALAKYMDKNEFGKFILLKQFFLILITFINIFGVPNSFAFFTAKSNSREINAKKIFLFMFIFGILIIPVIFVIELLLKPVFFNNIPSVLLFLITALIPIYFIQQALTGIFLGKNQTNLYTLSITSAPILFLIFSLIAIRYNYANANYITIIWIITSLLSIFICLYPYIKNYYSKQQTRSEEVPLNKLIKFGLFLMPVNITACLTGRIDRLIINHYLGAAAVAEYSIAIFFSEISLFISFALCGSIFKKVAFVKEKYAKAIVLKYLKYAFIFLIIFSVFYVPTALFAIQKIFATKFEKLPYLFLITYPGIALINLSMIIDTFITGQLGKPILNFYFTLPALISIVILDLIFIPKYGLISSSLIASLSYIMMVTIYIIFLLIRRPQDNNKNYGIVPYQQTPEV